jgi:hypothetical protein
MKTHSITRALGALTLVAGLAGCNDALNVEGTGAARVLLNRASDGSFPSAPAPQGAPGATRSVSPDTVQSLYVTVTAVEFFHAATDTSGSGWTAMEFKAPVQVNLMALSTNRDSAFVVAMGRAAAGAYSKVRLVVTNPKIRFRGDISFGTAGTVQGNTDYAVQLGTSGSTTIDINLSLLLQLGISGSSNETSDVRLEFAAASSCSSVTMTSTGSLAMSAVFQN